MILERTAPSPAARLVIIMGVSGSGKTTIGQALARRLHAPFIEGDEHHPPANIEKMRAGIPLDDADRWPWLTDLAHALADAAKSKGVAVGACSALKRAYRDFLVEQAGEPILFVHLDGTPELIGERVSRRQHAYMPQSLLPSQLTALEPPDPAAENALVVPADEGVEKIVRTILKRLDHVRSFKRWQ